MLQSDNPVKIRHASISLCTITLLGKTFEKTVAFNLGFNIEQQLKTDLYLQSQQDCVFRALGARRRRHPASSDIQPADRQPAQAEQ